MKQFLILLLFASLISLGFSPLHATELTQSVNQQQFEDNLPLAMQQSLAQLKSYTVLIYDVQNKHYLGFNQAEWDLPSIPASTFKVPHSLIALSLGVVDLKSIFKWDGKAYDIKDWQRDHNLHSAMKVSCVPCFQQIARKIGTERMQKALASLRFGQMDVQADNLDQFWLHGKSNITPRQQVDFMSRLALKALPVESKFQEQVQSLIADPNLPGLYGKTGWGRVPHLNFGDSVTNQEHFGWYVGYYQSNTKVYAFAIRLIGLTPLPENFVSLRKELTLEALKAFALLKS